MDPPANLDAAERLESGSRAIHKKPHPRRRLRNTAARCHDTRAVAARAAREAGDHHEDGPRGVPLHRHTSRPLGPASTGPLKTITVHFMPAGAWIEIVSRWT